MCPGKSSRKISAKKGLPLPLAPWEKWARSRPRKPFISRVCCAQRGIETIGLRPWSQKGPDHGAGVDPETVKIPGKILRNLYNKTPRHISAEGPLSGMPGLVVVLFSDSCFSCLLSSSISWWTFRIFFIFFCSGPGGKGGGVRGGGGGGGAVLREMEGGRGVFRGGGAGGGRAPGE